MHPRLRQVPIITLSSFLGIGLVMLMSSCGGGGTDETGQISAKNLETGEVKGFPSEADVPAGWGICENPVCSAVRRVPCEDLNTRACPKYPYCELTKRCDAYSAGSASILDSNVPPEKPPIVNCEEVCVPRRPIPPPPCRCERLTSEDECNKFPHCEWGLFNCPKCDDRTGNKCECKPSCHPRPLPPPPPRCEEITDPKVCLENPECGWEVGMCPAVCISEPNSTDCKPCKAPGRCYTQPIPPLPCEKITDPKVCLETPECGWEFGDCNFACILDSTGTGCLPCKAPGRCYTQPIPPPLACEEITDPKTCVSISSVACEWIPMPCEMFCYQDGSNPCSPCSFYGKCRPRPRPCPEVPPMDPTCPKELLETTQDGNGCVIAKCKRQFCGGIAGSKCPDPLKCELDGNYPDAGGHCVP